MKDLAIMGVQEIETSNPFFKAWRGLRKIFWTYLKKLHVPFYDACCDDANIIDITSVGYDTTTNTVKYYNGTAWVNAQDAAISGDTRYDSTSPSLLERYNGTTWVDIPVAPPVTNQTRYDATSATKLEYWDGTAWVDVPA